VTTDLFYGDPPLGGAVADMEAGAILQVAARRDVPAACVLALSPEEEPALRAGDAGYAAVSP
jgi:nucleoside phosphorylase